MNAKRGAGMCDQKLKEGGPVAVMSVTMRTMEPPLAQGHMKLLENLVLGKECQGPFEGIS